MPADVSREEASALASFETMAIRKGPLPRNFLRAGLRRARGYGAGWGRHVHHRPEQLVQAVSGAPALRAAGLSYSTS